jgi:hypothetical protein
MGFQFEDLGKFNVYIQTNLGYESENQGEYFKWKKTEAENLSQVYL